MKTDSKPNAVPLAVLLPVKAIENHKVRNACLPRPIHEDVEEIVVPILGRVVVFEFNMPS